MGLTPEPAQAWGVRGHGVVGVLALEQVQPATRDSLRTLLGSVDMDVIVGACYWPDLYRNMGDGAASAPQHYVHLPEDARSYRAQRDCPDGQCVTRSIVRYAEQLGDRTRSGTTRRLAFKNLCHYVGDLHQPLHAAYADDEGGGLVTVRYRGEAMSLHSFWDAGLIKRQTDSLEGLANLLRERPHQSSPPWSPPDTVAWTNESYELMRHFAYPVSRAIDDRFEQRSWSVTLQQLDVAAARLAAVLDSVLGDEAAARP